MKSALLHYWLVRNRGGEKVFAGLHRLLPDADIYTHAYRPLPNFDLGGVRVRESFIARLPFARVHPECYLPLMPMASRRLDLSAYDLIVSSESGPIKGIRKRPDQRHVCYCHTPMRYVWDMYDEYYASSGIAGRLAMRLFTPGMRRADLESAECVDEFIANSRFVAERIRRIYGREARVVHPPVDVDFFSAPFERSAAVPDRPYYLWAGALTSYKRLDLAREACKRMDRQLVIANGDWTREELRALYAGARALLFPGVEDFGIVSVEAQAAGTPVIAYGRGGALETVREGETGLFFRERTVESLCEAIEEFEGSTWDPAVCRTNAERFGTERFLREMKEILERPSREPVSERPALRIAVATHKPYAMPAEEAYLPLQVGAALHPAIAGLARDDVGENISAKNPNYCELTGLYWAWKNLDAHSLGLVHYRRLFAATAGEIAGALRWRDVVLPKKRHYCIETNYTHYIHAHHAQDLDCVREILAERHGDYLPAYEAVMKRTSGHRFNMMVMRREVLDGYCTWLFGILFELERRLDISFYSQYDARVFGFVAERLLDVWLERHGISYVEFPVRNLENQHWPTKIVRFLRRKFCGGKVHRS